MSEGEKISSLIKQIKNLIGEIKNNRPFTVVCFRF